MFSVPEKDAHAHRSADSLTTPSDCTAVRCFPRWIEVDSSIVRSLSVWNFAVHGIYFPLYTCAHVRACRLRRLRDGPTTTMSACLDRVFAASPQHARRHSSAPTHTVQYYRTRAHWMCTATIKYTPNTHIQHKSRTLGCVPGDNLICARERERECSIIWICQRNQN